MERLWHPRGPGCMCNEVWFFDSGQWIYPSCYTLGFGLLPP
jgi:hypothetical protein